jgi:hypothetical protein
MQWTNKKIFAGELKGDSQVRPKNLQRCLLLQKWFSKLGNKPAIQMSTFTARGHNN